MIRLLGAFCLLLFSFSLSAQVWPGRVATAQDVGRATDQFPDPPATLSASIGAGDLTIPVSDGTKFAQYNIVTIDAGNIAEKVLICGVASNALTVCTGGRGLDGTTAQSHLQNAPVACRVNATYYNNLASEVLSIEANFSAQVARDAPGGATNSFYQTVQYNTGTPVLTQESMLNFIPGPNTAIQIQDDPGNHSTDILISSLCSAGSGGSNYQTVDVAGTATTVAPALNFISANANLTIGAAFNSGANRTDLTFTASGGGGTAYNQQVQANGVNLPQTGVLNFQGNGVTGSSPAGVTTINIAPGTGTSGTVTSSPNPPDSTQCHSGVVGSFWQVTGATPSFYACNVTGASYTWTPLTVHPIGMIFDDGGPVLTVGETKYVSVPFACTIQAWDMTAISGTATINVWKLATGTAVPTSGNSITASATPAISSGNALHSTTLTGWTTAIAKDDIVAFHLNAVSGATQASLVLQCQ